MSGPTLTSPFGNPPIVRHLCDIYIAVNHRRNRATPGYQYIGECYYFVAEEMARKAPGKVFIGLGPDFPFREDELREVKVTAS